ncbi:MAG: hypothetical protein SFW36_17360 [Leptolyngbyaceae cyanobacterium bins.59]|nr:hypothetical protein [Leptolyngbyaceae cyanobacterium bins.59]
MHKILVSILVYGVVVLFTHPSQAVEKNFNFKACTYKGQRLRGRVQVVEAFPDIKVQVVKAFPDLNVQPVPAFPDRCGEWQFVNHFPDFTIQFVTAFPDVRVQFVEAFPGVP